MKRMLSGIKPTGRVTLGNYIGAIKPFVSYQDEYEMISYSEVKIKSKIKVDLKSVERINKQISIE